MIPVVSIVGNSGSGKTTLLERLITEIRGRGYSVAVVKHAGQDFEIDRQGKDSWRFMQAGADFVVVSSPAKLALIRASEHEASLEELSRFIGADFNLILTEGYRQDKAPKIEVHRKELGSDLYCSPQQLLAVVTDEPLEMSIPQYSMEDIKGVADLIEQRFLGDREEDMALFINGKSVPLNPFIKGMLGKTLTGMVSSLKGVEEVNRLDIWLKCKGKD